MLVRCQRRQAAPFPRSHVGASESRCGIRKGCGFEKLARGLEGVVGRVLVNLLALDPREKWAVYPSIREFSVNGIELCDE